MHTMYDGMCLTSDRRYGPRLRHVICACIYGRRKPRIYAMCDDISLTSDRRYGPRLWLLMYYTYGGKARKDTHMLFVAVAVAVVVFVVVNDGIDVSRSCCALSLRLAKGGCQLVAAFLCSSRVSVARPLPATCPPGCLQHVVRRLVCGGEAQVSQVGAVVPGMAQTLACM